MKIRSISASKGVLYLIAGFVIATAVFIFMGAGGESNIGRYQMEIISRNNFTDIFVIDTATGVIKYLGKDEGKPFDQIKGK